MNKKFLAITITLFAVFSFLFTGEVQAGSGDNVSGWAWSENIGWISFNCTNQGTCGTGNYGVNINSDGTFSGYAWSEHIGWIHFAPAGPYPTLPNYSTKVDTTGSGEVSGWARALNYGDGWDGWIKLKGSNYGVYINTENGEFSSWAWSDMVIGWISFNCSNQGVCGTSNYKVITSFIFNQPPSAINLSVDPPNSTDYCGITGYPLVRLKWQFSDPGDSQSAYQIQVAAISGFSPLVLDTGKITGSTGQSQAFVIQSPYPTLSWNTTYYWRLKVWDSQDTTSTDWIVYQNNTPPPESFTTVSHSYPYSDFTLSPQNPAIGEVVTFTDNSKCYSSPGNTEYSCSTGGSISYLWDFGNGQISTTKGNATTTYTTTGPKTVRLTITDNSLTPAGSCDTTRQVAITLPLPEYQEVPPTTWFKNLFAEIVNLFDGFLKI
ncbi:MAG: PKD domain-containing protein [Candidatus Nealsonbacteria bacterium]|nr:PKD domain-containing protein [Candidatus Nealsonbacteria bacterium]